LIEEPLEDCEKTSSHEKAFVYRTLVGQLEAAEK
jgi:hypothetical protein